MGSCNLFGPFDTDDMLQWAALSREEEKLAKAAHLVGTQAEAATWWLVKDDSLCLLCGYLCLGS